LGNKFHTLNSSGGIIPDSFAVPLSREVKEKSPQIDKEAEEAFYKGVKCLDNGDPQKAITYFTQILEKAFNNRKMVFIMLSIAYR
jgi:hypothetical protein